MPNLSDEEIFQKIQQIVYARFEKEYHCHLQYVLETAEQLQKIHGGDLGLIRIAAIAHDFGRVEDGNNDNHAQIGAEMIAPVLAKFDMHADRIAIIKACIAHTSEKPFNSIEEEIIHNADQGSKILYLPAFMLMVKKETFRERAGWAMKYLERIDRLTFEDFRARCLPDYQKYKQIYGTAMKDIVL